MNLFGKPIQFVCTAAWSRTYGSQEATLYIKTVYEVLLKYPHDMLVFEMPDKEHYQVRLAGHHFQTNKLDVKTVVFKTQSLPIKTFWCKVDDYGDRYVGTFLFPEDY